MFAPAVRSHGPFALMALLALTGCGTGDPSNDELRHDAADALRAVRPEAIATHMGVLAHDSLEGRAPGTSGFERASRYVETQFRTMGLEPAGDAGTYRQAVPLRESMTDEATSTFAITRSGRVTTYSYGTDFWLTPDATRGALTVRGPVIFVGYGVSAPTLGHDDYADVDVAGKVVAYVPGAPADLPNNPRAYYASGVVKRAEAARRGAIGAITLILPDDPPARWTGGLARARRGSVAWVEPDRATPGAMDAWDPATTAVLHPSALPALFADAPHSAEAALGAVQAGTHRSFDLAVEVTIHTVSTHRSFASHNIVARVPGSDPTLRDEHVVYAAHLDHFGRGEPINGDAIYNGAHDNASGVAIALEVARAFTGLSSPPRRSTLFVIVTAEEWGLLGSDYFVNHPTVPRAGLVANLSLDMPFLFHPLLDIVPYGMEHSTLAEAVRFATDHLGIAIAEDPIPEQVVFIRSDHYSFVQGGIPALFIKSGFATGDERDGAAINATFRRERYHTPQDDLTQPFDYDAGASHVRVNFLAGYYVTMQRDRPRWNDGDFFGTLFGDR